jgi:hypothetical protein
MRCCAWNVRGHYQHVRSGVVIRGEWAKSWERGHLTDGSLGDWLTYRR